MMRAARPVAVGMLALPHRPAAGRLHRSVQKTKAPQSPTHSVISSYILGDPPESPQKNTKNTKKH